MRGIKRGREMGQTFWHMISLGKVESERTPELRRCERVSWPRPLIEQCQRDGVKVWEEMRSPGSGAPTCGLRTTTASSSLRGGGPTNRTSISCLGPPTLSVLATAARICSDASRSGPEMAGAAHWGRHRSSFCAWQMSYSNSTLTRCSGIPSAACCYLLPAACSPRPRRARGRS